MKGRDGNDDPVKDTGKEGGRGRHKRRGGGGGEGSVGRSHWRRHREGGRD